ncbi:MAG: acyl--CoA ligase [Deltaproteobacteria bacterium]|nr:acyl--CoA ligase [Deltaproteobacteria bacterium]
MRLEKLLEEVARRDPDRAAIWQPGGPEGSWASYGELDRRASAIARRLRELGLEPGDRVAALLDNSHEWVASHFAVLKAGGVNVPLSTDLGARALAQILEHSGARALIAGRRYASVFDQIPKDSALPRLVLWDAPAVPDLADPRGLQHLLLSDPNPTQLDAEPLAALAVPAAPAAPAESDQALAAIIYTSGSTGQPKGVMLSHANLAASTESTVQYLGLTERDRMLVVLPFYYIYGLSLLYTHFWVGGSLLLDNRFAYPNVVLDTMAKREATGLAGVPSTFMLLLQKSTLKKRTFPRLRYVTQAGGAMAPTIQREVHQAFAPAQLFIMYGCTEAAPRLSYLDPDLLPKKWGSIGRAVPGVHLAVADDQGQPVARGEVGQIVARGANIMLGYWKDPEGTAEVLRDGLYFTGDLAREDEDGCLFIVGRSREILKVGGNRVSPKEIEETMLGFPGVAEVAVVGIDDPVLGEAAVAFVVRAEPGTVEEGDLRNFLKELLPSFKVPKLIRFRDSLPKSPAGKVLKPRLREEAAAEAPGPS